MIQNKSQSPEFKSNDNSLEYTIFASPKQKRQATSNKLQTNNPATEWET